MVKRFEGCRLEACPDPATGGDPWTVGWGHTGPEVHKGLTISQDIADAYLLKDLTHVADTLNHVPKLSRHRRSSTRSAHSCFNIGAANFVKSTLLRKLNAGDVLGAAMEFPKWRNAAGHVMPGLVTRRAAEQALFQLGG